MSSLAARSISRLASRTASGPRAAISSPIARARATASPAGTTSLTSPIRSRLGGVDDAPGQDQLLGPRRPDDPRQPLRAAGARA